MTLQRGILDSTAISLGAVCSLRPALEQLNTSTPPQSLCKLKNFVLLATTVFLSACMYWACVGYLTTQTWYVGGNGTEWKVSQFQEVC